MLKWSKELICGIDDIDRQHRRVIICIEKLLAACEKNQPREKILPLIEELDNYVTEHFKTEEKYAEDNNFPKLEELKKEHEFFKAIYYRLRYHYSYYDSQAKEFKHLCLYAIHLTKTMEEWLSFHLHTLDKELTEFLNQEH